MEKRTFLRVGITACILVGAKALAGCGIGEEYPDDVYLNTYVRNEGCLNETAWDPRGSDNDADTKIDWDANRLTVTPSDSQLATLTFDFNQTNDSWELSPNPETQTVLDQNNC